MLHTQNFMKVYTNVNGKENWKMVSAKGDNKKGIDLKIKEKGKPTINKKLDFKELFSLMGFVPCNVSKELLASV